MSEKTKIDQQHLPRLEDRQAVTEFPNIQEYCRQLDAQGIEYMIIPMQKLKSIDKRG